MVIEAAKGGGAYKKGVMQNNEEKHVEATGGAYMERI